MSRHEIPFDERTLSEKVMSGDVGSLNGGNIADVVNTGLGAASMAKHFIPAADLPFARPLGVALSGVSAYYDAEDTRAKISKYFGGATVRQLVRQNPVLRRKLEDDVDWLGLGGQMTASIGGGALGGMVGVALGATSLLSPIAFISPVLALGGTLAGGYIGNSLYDKAFVKQKQDPIIINMQINKMHEAGETVPPEVVFAALAANLPDRDARIADRLLKRYTRTTKLFAEAMADTKNIPILTAMMNNGEIDDAIRAQTRMPCDPSNPMKTVAEQYADMINSGQMKPQNMFNIGEGVFVMAAAMNQQQSAVDVPITPEMRHSLRERV